MGGGTSKQPTNLLHEYKVRGFKRDTPFGECRWYSHVNDNTDALLITLSLQNPEEFQTTWEESNRLGIHNHPHILKIHGSEVQKTAELCGEENVVNLLVEYHSLNLESEITRRRETSNYYSEEELWYLLLAISSAGAHFQKYHIFHGDLNPSNIFITSDGFVKIADHGLLTRGRTAYLKAFLGQSLGLLAPSQLKDLIAKRDRPTGSPVKGDAFALGMTMLWAATLQDVALACYSWGQRQFLSRKVDDLLYNVQMRYSGSFADILRQLLNPEDSERPDFTQIHTFLLPYQDKIENYDHFEMAPRKEASRKPGEQSASKSQPMRNSLQWLNERDPTVYVRYIQYIDEISAKINSGRYVAPAQRDEYERSKLLMAVPPPLPSEQEDELRRITLHLDTYANVQSY